MRRNERAWALRLIICRKTPPREYDLVVWSVVSLEVAATRQVRGHARKAKKAPPRPSRPARRRGRVRDGTTSRRRRTRGRGRDQQRLTAVRAGAAFQSSASAAHRPPRKRRLLSMGGNRLRARMPLPMVVGSGRTDSECGWWAIRVRALPSP
jgi:hypothetical protein